MIVRLDEIFASSSGVAHPAYCLTRKDVAFFSGNSQLEYLHGRQADKVEMMSEDRREVRIRLEKGGLVHGMRLVDHSRDTEQTAVRWL